MFNTSIHWTTFFYLLLDAFIFFFSVFQSLKLKNSTFSRYLILGGLFVAYNATGGFLPFENFPGPFILQYIITYGVAITLCIYMIYYIYKEYDIVIVKQYFSIPNISVLLFSCFIILFLLPYYITGSLDTARAFFTIPLTIIGLYFLWAFYKRIAKSPRSNKFTWRRQRLSILSISGVVLLPLLTVIGDYQWLTFTVMNTSFYAITTIEIDRYLYLLENKYKVLEVYAFHERGKENTKGTELICQNLTRREIEIAVSLLDRKSYKNIGAEFFITERTVSKHASNIFKKTGVGSRKEFLDKFGSSKK